jgi:hypothetical protein
MSSMSVKPPSLPVRVASTIVPSTRRRGPGLPNQVFASQFVLDDANTLDGYGDHYANPAASRDSGGANVGITFLNGDDGWHTDVAEINGSVFYQVRVTFHSNPETATDAELSALGLTWVQN